MEVHVKGRDHTASTCLMLISKGGTIRTIRQQRNGAPPGCNSKKLSFYFPGAAGTRLRPSSITHWRDE